MACVVSGKGLCGFWESRGCKICKNGCRKAIGLEGSVLGQLVAACQGQKTAGAPLETVARALSQLRWTDRPWSHGRAARECFVGKQLRVWSGKRGLWCLACSFLIAQSNHSWWGMHWIQTSRKGWQTLCCLRTHMTRNGMGLQDHCAWSAAKNMWSKRQLESWCRILHKPLWLF